MRTISLLKGDHVFRWSGGSFVGVWKSEHSDEHVPFDMIRVPASINRAHASRTEVEFIADTWLAEHSEETTAGLLREVLDLTDQVVAQTTDEDVARKYRELMERIYRENR